MGLPATGLDNPLLGAYHSRDMERQPLIRGTLRRNHSPAPTDDGQACRPSPVAGKPWRIQKTGPWVLATALVLLPWAAISVLSASFVHGEGHAERPIGLFLALYLISWSGFALGCFLVWWRLPHGGRFIIGVGLLARCFLLPSNLIQENDCYRYVLDGEALVQGVNPYAHAPKTIAEEGPDRKSVV